MDQWTVVLLSQGIDSAVGRRPHAWVLLVDELDAERAASVLDKYEEENAVAPRPKPIAEYGPTSAGFAMAGLLVAFYAVTGPRDPEVVWFRLGSASAERILDGELWRAVTALTLHADVGHLLANAASCALFATAVCRSVGPGVGACLIVLAGALGNVMNALAHGSGHASVGASTGIFGAVGLLGGLGLVRRRRVGYRGGRAWAPIAAGLALLAMLGTGEGTDLPAHLFGFLSGALLGVVTGVPLRTLPSVRVQWTLALGLLVGVVVCWRTALP